MKKYFKIVIICLVLSWFTMLSYTVFAEGESTKTNVLFEDTKKNTMDNPSNKNFVVRKEDEKEGNDFGKKIDKQELQTVNNYFIGTFRLYDIKTGKTYDFLASKGFTYDYKQKVPPLIMDGASMDIFIQQMEEYFSDKSLGTIHYAEKIAGKNKYKLIEKNIAKTIDKKAFEAEMARRIKVADYSLFEVPFLDNEESVKIAKEKELILLSEYTTKYNAGDYGRSSNIVLAGTEINGTKLAPGEKFYFNSRIAPISSNLKVAKVIVNNTFVNGVGGGLCQVSTTLFNAALEAGLQIDFRRPHSLPIYYAPRGRDAMVASHSDFVFSNNLKHDIYIMYEKTGYDGITFKIFGSKEDKKTIKTWVTGGGKYFVLHRVGGNSKAEETFYSSYQGY